mgnify:CR=1 FL=1
MRRLRLSVPQQRDAVRPSAVEAVSGEQADLQGAFGIVGSQRIHGQAPCPQRVDRMGAASAVRRRLRPSGCDVLGA